MRWPPYLSPSSLLVVATIAVLAGMAWSVGATLGEQREAIRELRVELREPGSITADPGDADSVPDREDVFRTVPEMLERLEAIEGRLDELDGGDP